ncbi:iron-containing alcohol dehydrogenase [Vibrio algarum]|uniref:Iron-containing alcohol dehydrogenase n=1 Tax=Vibrio algarum TaxID=3020714 RepID=A0ABT4YQY0_9VIBR|nr:iron-containing alcohol dehydrogenase [Vibrio sp. KJ40-1]MDB1123964.1 iron-containing alcohol dehydrogenase [Vibrio sp. KJ40-1]
MFQFMTSAKVVFGEGALNSSLSIFNQYGYSVLLVTGKSMVRAAPIVGYLKNQNMRYQHVSIIGEPNITMVEETAAVGRRFKPDMVVAIGGGSVIDMGKALSAIIPNQGDVYDYVEVVGRSVPLKSKPIPFIAIPTTASTGSEVTNKAVLRSGQDKVKVSLRSSDILPDVAIVDPTLTYDTNLAISSRGALETFTHLMESYVCGEPNPLTDTICEEGLRRLTKAIIPGCKSNDYKARSDLSFAAMLGGMAISNSNLGAAHGLASSLGGKIEAPHSIITARLAPFVMDENIKLAVETGRSDILNRYREIAKIVTQNTNADYPDSIAWIQMMLERLELPNLSEFGICKTSFSKVAKDAMQSSSIKGNPLPLNEERLIFILQQVCSCEDFGNVNNDVVVSSSVEIEEVDFQSREEV